MTLHISISGEAEAKLRQQAAAGGLTPEAVAARLVEEGLGRQSLEQLLAPIWSEFDATGMSDDQLSEVLERAKHEQRQERRSRRAS